MAWLTTRVRVCRSGGLAFTGSVRVGSLLQYGSAPEASDDGETSHQEEEGDSGGELHQHMHGHQRLSLVLPTVPEERVGTTK